MEGVDSESAEELEFDDTGEDTVTYKEVGHCSKIMYCIHKLLFCS